MFKKFKTDYINWFFLIGLAVLLLEVLFFNGGLIAAIVIAVGCIYYGRKWSGRTMGKALLWFGWIWLVITILNMMTFKYFLIAIILYFIIEYYQSKKNPNYIKPEIIEVEHSDSSEPLIKRRSLFENKFFSNQKTPDHVYEWNDVNIQVGVGNTIVDLSNTVLSKEEAVISIRHFIGNVQILVPYEVGVTVNHSVLIGSAKIFQQKESKLVNEAIIFQTPDYEESGHKVKIITSMLTGDLEVKRL
ncbi:cell wall-active antibiotics response protein LiaF [Metabacillus fastidiosus]|uniref:cell wall-active antibiotics response protein LiaF n=1 Tax=Metabacillus fastidiosus TaxID=1458 RepID=UPI003D2A1013